MQFEFLNAKKAKPINKYLQDHFGMKEKLPFQLSITTKNDIYAITHDIIDAPLDQLKIHTPGIYIGEWKFDQLRLSVEGASIVAPLATKNILTVSEKLEKMWLYGLPIPFAKEFKGFNILKSENGDILGSTRFKEEKLINFVPKGRRIHE